MNTEAFIAAYNESRNGCDYFVRHPLVRTFQYTDGVQSCAEAGCYWLLDILATEVPAILRIGDMTIVYVAARGGKANIRAELTDGVIAWSRKIDTTDLPNGEWIFYITREDDRVAMILPTEH